MVNTDDIKLTGWWRMEDANANLFYNSANKSQNPLIASNVTLTNGSKSWDGIKAASFTNASSSFMFHTDSSLFNFGSSDFTLAAWVYIDDSTPTESYCICSKYKSNGSQRSWYFYINSSRQPGLYMSSDGTTDNSKLCNGATITEQTWQHVAVVKSGTTIYWYINGVLKETDTGAPASIYSSTAAFLIGAVDTSVSSPDFNMNGDIDDVRIYTRALNSAEIKYIMHGRGYA